MPFDSNTGRMAGQKSRKGKHKEVGQLRGMLMQELDTGRLRYALAELDHVQYVRAMATLMQYAVPRLQAIQIASAEDVEQALEGMSIAERQRIAQKLIKMATDG